VPRDAEIVVIGAGVTGATTARALAVAGRDVLLVEQFGIGHERGSSHGTSRVFRLSYPEERWVRLAQRSLEGWLELEAECGARLLRQTGSLDLGSFVPANRRALAACGASSEHVDSAEIEARWQISWAAPEPGLFQADGGVILADKALQALVAGAREGGATVLEQTPVLEVLEKRGAVRVVTGRGEIRARAAVVAAGAWSQRLLSPLEIELPVIPTRETVAYVSLARAETLPALIDEETPSAAGHGVLREGQISYALHAPGIGLKVGVHHSGPVADPDDEGAPDTAIVRWASEWAARRFPADDVGLRHAETCLYTNTADESFILERHGRIVVASPCSGHGFKFAPVLGQTLAALAREASI
jgi:sarcosine oxidase